MAKIACRTAVMSGLVAAACLMVSARWVNAQNAQSAANNVATGRELAERLCSECHVVVPSGKGGWTDAPAFDAIANRQGTTAAELSGFIQQPHMQMVHTARPPREADLISAYIMSLRTN